MKQFDILDAYGQRQIFWLRDNQIVDLYNRTKLVVDGEKLLDVKFSPPDYSAELPSQEDENITYFHSIDWKATKDNPEAFWTFNDYIRVDIDRVLTDEEVDIVSGAVGYAARTELRGENLSLPEVTIFQDGENMKTALCFYYDLTKTYSDDPGFHFDDFSFKAEEYIKKGSPPYKTNYKGRGIGFQLVKGIGACGVTLYTD